MVLWKKEKLTDLNCQAERPKWISTRCREACRSADSSWSLTLGTTPQDCGKDVLASSSLNSVSCDPTAVISFSASFLLFFLKHGINRLVSGTWYPNSQNLAAVNPCSTKRTWSQAKSETLSPSQHSIRSGREQLWGERYVYVWRDRKRAAGGSVIN